MHEANLLYRSSTIHYKYTKAGSKLLICWHGYDESSASFAFLEQQLPEFSLLCIDLPHHGCTEWNENSPITIQHLIEIINEVRSRVFPGINTYSLLGFSLGGRLALTVFQTVPEAVDNIVLLAPDGINTNFWHWFSTRTIVGKRIFRFSISNPWWIFSLLKIGNRLGMINQSVYKFTRYYLQDKRSREFLYKRWICMRKINPDRKLIKQAAMHQQIVLKLVYGEYDRIIKHERAQDFCRELNSNCKLHVLSCGHQVLQEKNAVFIAGLLQQ